jgi:hypothetical protein
MLLDATLMRDRVPMLVATSNSAAPHVTMTPIDHKTMRKVIQTSLTSILKQAFPELLLELLRQVHDCGFVSVPNSLDRQPIYQPLPFTTLEKFS